MTSPTPTAETAPPNVVASFRRHLDGRAHLAVAGEVRVDERLVDEIQQAAAGRAGP